MEHPTSGDATMGETARATPSIVGLVRAISAGDVEGATRLLNAAPLLAFARLERVEECFIEECSAQLYAGDTALHGAAHAHDVGFARRLVEAGADVRARNRRGAEPLHSATRGGPGSTSWHPGRQSAVIVYLVAAGADPNALAAGGVTPLHRAVRNRCAAAVEALLIAGADPSMANKSGSTALDLARWTTGRGGTGSSESRAEQQRIIELLEPSRGNQR
jgi:ankyrin repeat protein